ncbi:Hypothetical protein HVR_LOCUS862 [uncultured virus]|nr:Hypothetical protein HVR_LOCUS862 [uncultured virus]
MEPNEIFDLAFGRVLAGYGGYFGFTLETRTYIRSLILPYIEALDAAATIDQILDWIYQVFPVEIFNKLLKDIQNIETIKRTDKLDAAKTLIVLELIGILTRGTYENEELFIRNFMTGFDITPWMISKYRTELAQRLFGPASSVLPITVTVNGNSLEHEVNEEFAAGLVSVFSSPEWVPNTTQNNVKFMNIELQERYTFNINLSQDNKKRNPNYTVTIDLIDYVFDTPDFMQGVLTAIDWLGLDKGEVIQNFRNAHTKEPLQIQ